MDDQTSKVKERQSPTTTLRTYLIVTGASLGHIFVSLNLFAFGLLQIHAEGLFHIRNQMEAYLTSNYKKMVLSALPEFLLFPPAFIAILLSYFYALILYHQFFDTQTLLAKQRVYTRYSLVTPFPHAVFVAFFTIDGLVIYLAAARGLTPRSKSYFLVILSVGSVCNAAWLLCLLAYFPSFVRYRRDLVTAEKALLRETRERVQEVVSRSRAEKASQETPAVEAELPES